MQDIPPLKCIGHGAQLKFLNGQWFMTGWQPGASHSMSNSPSMKLCKRGPSHGDDQTNSFLVLAITRMK